MILIIIPVHIMEWQLDNSPYLTKQKRYKTKNMPALNVDVCPTNITIKYFGHIEKLLFRRRNFIFYVLNFCYAPMFQICFAILELEVSFCNMSYL